MKNCEDYKLKDKRIEELELLLGKTFEALKDHFNFAIQVGREPSSDVYDKCVAAMNACKKEGYAIDRMDKLQRANRSLTAQLKSAHRLIDFVMRSEKLHGDLVWEVAKEVKEEIDAIRSSNQEVKNEKT